MRKAKAAQEKPCAESPLAAATPSDDFRIGSFSLSDAAAGRVSLSMSPTFGLYGFPSNLIGRIISLSRFRRKGNRCGFLPWSLRNGTPKSTLFPNRLFTESLQTGLFLDWQARRTFTELELTSIPRIYCVQRKGRVNDKFWFCLSGGYTICQLP